MIVAKAVRSPRSQCVGTYREVLNCSMVGMGTAMEVVVVATSPRPNTTINCMQQHCAMSGTVRLRRRILRRGIFETRGGIFAHYSD